MKRWAVLFWLLRAAFVWPLSYLGALSKPTHVTDARWLDCFHRWDASHYIHLAEAGYHELYLAAFFPGFPLALRAMMARGLDPLAAGVALNFALLLIGLLFVGAYAERELPYRNQAIFLLAITCFHSATYFFTSIYAEAAFYVCVAAALFARKEDRLMPALRWLLLASACAIAATLRPQGLAVAVFVAMVALERKGERWFFLSASACGGLALSWHLHTLWMSYGDPLAFMAAQKLPMWNRQVALFGVFKALFADFHYAPDYFVAVYWSVAAIALRAARRAPWPETMMLAMMVLLPLSTGTVWSYPRFYLTMIPAHVEMARAPKTVRVLYLIFMAAYALRQTYRVGANFAFQ